jgi:hypothetical protein
VPASQQCRTLYRRSLACQRASFTIPPIVPENAAGQERIASGLHLCSSVDLNPSQDFAMFKLGKPETPMQWIGHVVLAIVALFLVWWLFRAYVL